MILSLLLVGKHLVVAVGFIYLGNCVAENDSVIVELTKHVCRTRRAYAELKHLWHRPGTPLKLKSHVYFAVVRLVLLIWFQGVVLMC